jgi:hypothetical protein
MNAPFPYIGKVKTAGRKLMNQLMFVKESGAPARSLDRRLQKARAAWFREMQHFKDGEGCILLPDDAPMLTDDALKNCQMLPYREAILERMKKEGIAAEVGVQAGYFSENIIRICQPKRLHLLDLYLQKYRIAEKFKDQVAANTVQLHEGDSATQLQGFDDGYFDFIYIDADHSYKGVKRDIAAAKHKVKEDGFLIFNDYTYWSPVECINYGVIRAVNELCLEENWEIVYYALAGYMYCDVALRRRKH